MINFKKTIIYFLLIIQSTLSLAESKIIDKIVTIVNSDVILQSDIDQVWNKLKIKTIKTKTSILDNEYILKKQILENLITNKIMLQLAERMNIKFSKQKIEEHIKSFLTEKGTTLNQFKNELLKNEISWKQFSDDIYISMIISELSNNEIKEHINILPEEIDSLAEKLNLYTKPDIYLKLHYLFIPLIKNINNKKREKNLYKINQIMKQIKQNVNFDKIAIKYSTKLYFLHTGNIGWSKIEELPILIDKNNILKKGNIIKPIQSKSGMYIFKIQDIKYTSKKFFITEIKTHQILIKISPLCNNTQAYQKLKKITQDINAGKISFINAAKRYSQDYNSALNGGLLDWHPYNMYNPELYINITKMKIGEISKPVFSESGWYLIKLDNIRQVDQTNLIHKENAYRILFNNRFNEASQNWIKKQRALSYIRMIK